MPNPYEAEIDALRKEVQKLTNENKYIKQRLSNLIKVCTVENLIQLNNTVISYCDDLGSSTPIVKDEGNYYKLGVCFETHPVKDIRQWCKDSPSADCSQLKDLSDDTVVIVIT